MPKTFTKSSIQLRRYRVGELITKMAASEKVQDPQEFNKEVAAIKGRLSSYMSLDVSTINRDIRITWQSGRFIPKTRAIAYASFFGIQVSDLENNTIPQKVNQ